ncbi:MAG: hypothetical protein GEV09_16445 [Pseudonocardiaceae bacterium]|nr:hypothetical protein [Pseudonocardiaceae bacterium]
MSTERVTVSLPADLLAEARHAVQTGTATSVSAYIAEAVRARLRRDRALTALSDLYGGAPPDEELAAARDALGTATASRPS